MALLVADQLGGGFLILGYLGTQPPTPPATLLAQFLTLVYFAFFALMPWWSRMGSFKPVPERVTRGIDADMKTFFPAWR